MVNTCYVPFCQSGYKKRRKSEDLKLEKIPIFSLPTKKPDLPKKWTRFINGSDDKLAEYRGACAKHFLSGVLKNWR